MKKAIITKIVGGLFAVGIMATALVGQAAPASADGPQPLLDTCKFHLIGVKPKPDLTFDGVYLESHNGKLVARIKIHNNGCATQSGFWVSTTENAPSYALLQNGKFFEPAMAKGEHRERVLELGYPATPELHNFHVSLDNNWGDPASSNLIDESDEYNNAFYGSFQM